MKAKTLKPSEAETRIFETVGRVWHDKALEMFRHFVNSTTTVSGLRVPATWPVKGTIRFVERKTAQGQHVIRGLGWMDQFEQEVSEGKASYEAKRGLAQ